MNPRRIIILIVAVAVGALAAAGLLSYVRAAQTSSEEAAAPVEIWVVAQPIPKGTTAEVAIEQGLLRLDRTAQEFRPVTAVTDLAELTGLVAIIDLPANAQLVSGMFASPRLIDTGITDRLNARGLVTVTLNVDQSRGAANLIEPGDFVNIMIERQFESPFFRADPPVPLTPESQAELLSLLNETDTRRPVITDLYPVETRVVYQKAEVLAVGQEVIPDLGESAPAETDPATVAGRGIITLAVPPEAAINILSLGRENIYLSLVPADYEPRPLLPVDPTRQVLPGELPDQLTPYQGYDVDDPSLAAGNPLVNDDENRIGATPGSSTEPGEAETGGGEGAATSGDADEGSGADSGAGTTTTTEPDGQ